MACGGGVSVFVWKREEERGGESFGGTSAEKKVKTKGRLMVEKKRWSKRERAEENGGGKT